MARFNNKTGIFYEFKAAPGFNQAAILDKFWPIYAAGTFSLRRKNQLGQLQNGYKIYTDLHALQQWRSLHRDRINKSGT